MKTIILVILFGCGVPRVELYCEKPQRLTYKYDTYFYEPIF